MWLNTTTCWIPQVCAMYTTGEIRKMTRHSINAIVDKMWMNRSQEILEFVGALRNEFRSAWWRKIPLNRIPVVILKHTLRGHISESWISIAANDIARPRDSFWIFAYYLYCTRMCRVWPQCFIESFAAIVIRIAFSKRRTHWQSVKPILAILSTDKSALGTVVSRTICCMDVISWSV